MYSHKFPHELPPHVYATSAASYRGLTTHNVNQCILVSGESGAGKTETVKILMNHLAFIAGKQDDKTVDKLLKANPLLESFGNAKTIRNDNSSRFGKFSQLEFDGQNTLVGSKCVTYLLEKSRVVGQSPNERSYHVMYELLAAPEDVRENLFLVESNHPADYFYLTNGDLETTVIEGVSDDDRFLNTIAGLRLLNISEETCGLLAKTLASVLHLGQLSFNIQSESNAGDAAMISPRGSDFVSDRALKACCELLGVSDEIFLSTMVNRHIEVQGKRLDVPLTLEQAISGRDALAKEIYARLFNWLVLVINFNTSSIANAKTSAYDKNSPRSRLSAYATISLLDIFGFESFNVNRFEQLCINYANEKLQQKFAQDVFKTVQREYLEEGIGLESIAFKDNSDVLDLIDGKPSVISFLTEECKLPKGSDASFLSKLSKQFATHSSFSIPRFSKNAFAITHYAGSVSYNVQGFLERNKDTLPNNFAEMLVRSENLLVQRLFMYANLFANSDTDGFLAGDRERNGLFLLLDPLPVETAPTPITSPSRFMTPMVDKQKVKRVRAGSLNNTFSTTEEDLVPEDSPVSPLHTPLQVPKSEVTRDPKSATPSIFDTSQVVSRMRSASQSGGLTSPPGGTSSRARSVSASAKGTRPRASSSGVTPLIDTMSTSSFMTAETVTIKFQTQLAQLMDLIAQTEVHYVRCIKPNPNKSATQFSRALVVEQLRSGGMIAAVKISRAAYPNRLFYSDFIDRYRFLQSPSWHIQENKRVAHLNDGYKEAVEICKALVSSVIVELKGGIRQKVKNDAELFQFGYTKIYFSNLFMERLEAIRALKYSSFATKIQTTFRRFRAVQIYQEIRRRIIRMQALMRAYSAYSHFKKRRAKVILIQSLARRWLAKKRFLEYQEYAKLSSAEQARLTREQAEREEAERLRLEEEAERERIRLEEEAERERVRLAEIAAAEEAARLERERIQRELEEENERIKIALEQQEIARRLKEEENERLRLEAEAAQEQLRLEAALREEQLLQLQQEQDAVQANLLQAQAECEKVRLDAMQREAMLMEQLQVTSEQLHKLFHEFETKQAALLDEKESLKQEAERISRDRDEESETWREVTETLKVKLSETESTVEATQRELNKEKETWQEREARLKRQLEETEGKVAKTELELIQERETWQQQEERLKLLLAETEDKSVTLLELTQRENDAKLQQISDRHAQIASAITAEKEDYETRLQRAESLIEVEKRRTRSEMIEKQRAEKAQRDMEEEFAAFKESSRTRLLEEHARRLDAEEKLRLLVECIDSSVLKSTPIKSDLAKKFPEILPTSTPRENMMDISFESVTPSTKTLAVDPSVDSIALKSLMTILELLSFANASHLPRTSLAALSGKSHAPLGNGKSPLLNERMRSTTESDPIPAVEGATASCSPVTTLDGTDMELMLDAHDGFSLTEDELESLQYSLIVSTVYYCRSHIIINSIVTLSLSAEYV